MILKYLQTAFITFSALESQVRFSDNTAGTFVAPTATDSRSPCPALNTLANHGYISRDGRNIQKEDLVDALVSKYNVDAGVTNTLANSAYAKLSQDGGNTIDLGSLQLHGFIEHDVSTVHEDTANGNNWVPVEKYVTQLLAHSSDGKVLTMQDVVNARQLRLEQCMANNKNLTWTTKEKTTASAEAVLALLVFKGDQNELPVSYARSFFLEERFPDGYKSLKSSIGWVKIGASLAKYAATQPN